MKQTKKILLSVLLVATLLVVGIFASTAADTVAGSIDELTALVMDVEFASSSEKMEVALNAVTDYLKNYPIDPTTEGYAELAAKITKYKGDVAMSYVDKGEQAEELLQKVDYCTKAVAWFEDAGFSDEDMAKDEYKANKLRLDVLTYVCADGLYKDIQTVPDDSVDKTADEQLASAVNSRNVKRLRAFLKKVTLNLEVDGADAEFEKKVEDAYKVIEDARQRLVLSYYADAPLLEYSGGYAYQNDFEGTLKNPSITQNGTGYDQFGNIMNNPVSKESGMDGDNHYFTVRYRAVNSSGGGLASYVTFGLADTTKSVVFEFDITTFDKLPEKGFIFQISTSKVAGGSVIPTWLQVDANGNISHAGWDASKGENYLEAGIVPGEWTKLAFVFDINDQQNMDVYIDGVYLLTTTAHRLDNAGDFNLANPRMGNMASKTGEFSIDNVRFYYGTAPRDDDYIKNLSDAEKFLFYVDYYTDTKKSAKDVELAYTEATKLVSKFGKKGDDGTVIPNEGVSDEIYAALVTYFTTPLDAVLNGKKEANLKTFVSLVEAVEEIKPSLSSTSSRKSKLEAVERLLTANTGYILDDAEGVYYAKSEIYNTLLERYNQDVKMISFIDYMNRFENSTTSAAKKKHLASAESYLPISLDLFNPEHPDYKFYEAEKASYDTFKAAYDMYVKESDNLINGALRLENSKKLVGFINYIAEYDTEEEWIANYELLANYTSVIRGILNSGFYDETYAGLAQALAVFEPVNDYFYADLQLVHIEFLTEQLAAFSASTSFVEKNGISAHIERYIVANDLDESNAQVAELLGQHEACKAELDVQKDSYPNQLKANTTYFINYATKLDTAITYKDKKAIYEEAYYYYFAINVGSEEAAEAVALFERIEDEILATEALTAEFISYVNMLPLTKKQTEIFDILKSCYEIKDDVELEIEGAKEAYEAYEAALHEFSAPKDVSNDELASVDVVVGSLRVNNDFEKVISTILKNIFG